jgi:hypothetical protein
MLLDNSSTDIRLQLTKTNFLGKDGFTWWVGQVAPLKTSGGDKLQLKSRSEKQEGDLYYGRVKVRIIGYHTANCEELPDKDLPWAHIMVPPGSANGTLNSGSTHEYKGGETVLGFFLDGDDGQQPVVMGSLFKNTSAKPEVTFDEILTKNCSSFKVFEPQRIGNSQLHNTKLPGNLDGGKNVLTGVEKPLSPAGKQVPGLSEVARVNPKETDKASVALGRNIDNQTTPVVLCQDDQISRITRALEDFTKRMEGIQQYLDAFVAPVVGKLANIGAEIKQIGQLIAGIITGLIKKGMKWLFEEISRKAEKAIGRLFSKSKQPVAAQTVRTIMSTIYCIFKKILKSLLNFIINSLLSFLGNILNAAACFVENFLSQLLNSIFGKIADLVSGPLQQLSSFLGGALGSVSGLLSKAMGIANFIKSLINCEDRNCQEKAETYNMRYGPKQEDVDKFNKILGKAGAGGVASLLNDLSNDLELDGGYDFGAGGCNPNILRCGPPEIQILGGGGFGAAAKAVVNNFGRVIGADLSSLGFGYKEEPVVSIIDACNNGQFARGRAILGGENGQQVIAIIIDDPGEGYLNNITTQEYGQDPISIPNDQLDKDSKTVYSSIDTITISNGGSGYNSGEIVSFGECRYSINAGPAGMIISLTPVNECSGGFTEIPEAVINTENGVGAVLNPVLKFTEVNQSTGLNIDQNQIIQVIDCVQR